MEYLKYFHYNIKLARDHCLTELFTLMFAHLQVQNWYTYGIYFLQEVARSLIIQNY